jgi:transporter family protein
LLSIFKVKNPFSSILENKKAIGFILLSSVAGATSLLFYFLALKDGKVSQVSIIVALA